MKSRVLSKSNPPPPIRHYLKFGERSRHLVWKVLILTISRYSTTFLLSLLRSSRLLLMIYANNAAFLHMNYFLHGDTASFLLNIMSLKSLYWLVYIVQIGSSVRFHFGVNGDIWIFNVDRCRESIGHQCGTRQLWKYGGCRDQSMNRLVDEVRTAALRNREIKVWSEPVSYSEDLFWCSSLIAVSPRENLFWYFVYEFLLLK